MGIWVIDVYAEETDKVPVHRAVVRDETEEDALLSASKAYPNDKVVVSVGRTLDRTLSGSEPLRELW